MSCEHSDSMMAKGRDLSERVMPGLEKALADRYDALLPGFSEWQISTVYGGVYARDALDLRTRQIATIAALAALGGQTRAQLGVHVKAARKMDISRAEIAEVIMQMSLYGGFPAAINALNAAMDVFEAEEEASDE